MVDHELAGQLRGMVARPGDPGYDGARRVWNARFDRHPDLVARCVDVDDVAAAVGWARRHDVTISVKGGGHSYAGNTVADGGILIDLSGMTGIRTQPEARLATVEAGATWRSLDSATQQHGLATTGATVSSVGVAGSTLGGGTGWLSRRLGNAVDNVLAVELVTAQGEHLRVTEEEHPDLFWGVRGAGPNLGLATSFDFRLHEVGPEVLAGQVIYPFDRAEELLGAFVEIMAGAPDDFQCLPFTFRVPPVEMFPEELHGQPVLDFVVFHREAAGHEVVDRLRSLGGAIIDSVAASPYIAAQQAFDANLPAGQRYFSRAHDLAALTEGAIADFTDQVRRMQGSFTVAYLEPRGGQVARMPHDATASGGRGAPYSFHIIAGWSDPGEDASVMAWARAFSDVMGAHSTGGVYVNLIAEDELERVPTAFSDHARLRALKRKWDPENAFRVNHNLLPA